jgi:putative photosynthetic complex assembly protein
MFAIAAGLLFVIGGVSLAKISNTVVTVPAPVGVPVASRVLAFRDTADGAVLVRDKDDGQTIAQFASGEGSFVRGVLRSLARSRKAMGFNDPGFYALAQYGDGRLIIVDVDTGHSIDLVAFGPTNMQSFAMLLTHDRVGVLPVSDALR